MIEFSDDFDGALAPLDGRVSPSGHTWGDPNNRFQTSGTGLLEAQSWSQGSRYADVHLTEGCRGMSAVAQWEGASTSTADQATLTLISSQTTARNGSPGSYSIYDNAFHPVFGEWNMGIDFYTLATGAERLYTYNYPGGRIPENTPATFGWEYDGANTVTITAPDGTTHTVSDPRMGSFIGPHLIYQIWNSGRPNNKPRYLSVDASIADPPPPPPPVDGTVLSLGGSMLSLDGSLLALPPA